MLKCTEKPEHANTPAYVKITGEGLNITPCEQCYHEFIAADPEADWGKMPSRRWKRIELIQRRKNNAND